MRASTRSSANARFALFLTNARPPGEFARVLKPGGQSRNERPDACRILAAELTGLLAWIACIADARPVDEYAQYLEAAGMRNTRIEPHDEALAEMVRDIQGKLLGAELMSKLKKLDLGGVNFAEAKSMARAAADAVRAKKLGYAIITAST